MSFPLKFANQIYESAPQFAKAVLHDADKGGSQMFPGKTPHEWICEHVISGVLPREMVLGLSAFMIRSERPAAIAEGIRIAEQLELHPIARILTAAIEGFPLSLLLVPDPFFPEKSLEDTLLEGVIPLMSGTNSKQRAMILERLRNAGLPQKEIAVLVEHGSAEEIRTWLPIAISEGLMVQELSLLRPGFLRSVEIAQATSEALTALPLEQRKQLWKAVVAAAPLMAKNKTIKAVLVNSPQSPTLPAS